MFRYFTRRNREQDEKHHDVCVAWCLHKKQKRETDSLSFRAREGWNNNEVLFDTDKAFHMSFDEVTFNADRIRSKLELLSEELMPRCGLVYELYQRRLSAAIDNFVATLPTEQHLLVLELAREEFDYLSAEEIAEEIRRDSERGYCCHGFERNCCPLGCGDLGDDCCDAADLMEEP